MEVTRTLAQFIVNHRYADVPAGVRHEAARNGLLAALLAQRGFTSSNHGIEAQRGFATVMSTAFKPEDRCASRCASGMAPCWRNLSSTRSAARIDR